MKKVSLIIIGIALASFLIGVLAFQDSSDEAGRYDAKIDSLMNLMTIDEKIGQLNLPAAGDISTGLAQSSGIAVKIKEGKVGGLFNIRGLDKIREAQRVAVEESRLGIPLIFAMDVIHGYKTVFPIPIGLSCTWDMDMIRESARIAANEATADGIAWTFSPMVDISRDPRWGRIAEGVGEDPYLGYQISYAMVKGYQSDDLTKNNTMMACVKHFALYGASEAGRDYNTVDMSRIRMFNEYLPPYKGAVDAGVGSVMASFNEIDGIPATGNKWLMTDLLRERWGFDGFIVTDYTGINEMIAHGMGDLQQVSALALKAGIDMDMVGEGFLTTLKKSLEEGKIKEEDIDKACRRILEAKYMLGLFDDPYKYMDENRSKTEIFTEENRKKAREIAANSFVLLKNDNNTLPLAKEGTIALIGPMADNRENMPGTWSVAADFKNSVSVLDGLKNVVGSDVEILTARGANFVKDPKLDERISVFGKPTYRDSRSEEEMIKEAVEIADKSDVIVAAIGESSEMSGESSSRTSIKIPKTQRNLLKELLKTGKPVILVVFTGRPLDLSWEDENVPAILNVWFGGTETGNAIADVLFGDVNPSGKLSVTFPRNIGQVPIFYNHKNTGRPITKEWFQKFKSNYLDVPNTPLYPFGYGLSYTNFEYSDMSLSSTDLTGDASLEVSVQVTNSGPKDGAEVVQLYIRDMVGSTTRPVKELKKFEKIFLKAGESREVKFNLTTKDLEYYTYPDSDSGKELVKIWEPGEFEIMIGTNSADTQSEMITWNKKSSK
ncbi:beta-glucosidase BglX [Mangrovivirga sp. M17]|uniref:beta-glucosidase n=1 Tax=Mangrovivirga halotolerans TaxID=2993936 RepID=A0ABT3RLB2_9BACT|nr:beta-glucosidase BglX [Mangrovivirga halotolerans]MCX2742293.1 beta-glucosidase BglX [Mangrovivirga halotolerans]